MDMTPYIGRVRLSCRLNNCEARNRVRIFADCVICPNCEAVIIDLESKAVQVVPLAAPQPEPQAAANPRPKKNKED